MAWNVVEPEKGKRNRMQPSASVGFGRISLSVSACNLLGTYEQYKCVELLTDPEKPSVVGIRFLRESTENSIQIKRRTANGKVIGGMDIVGKSYMEKLFGIAGTQNKATKYPVTKDSENILVIHTR